MWLPNFTPYSEIFVPTGWTKKREVIVGRDKEFGDLLRLTKMPGSHAVMFGQRGSGKTTIRDRFGTDMAQLNWSVIKINCSEGLTYSALIKNILQKIGHFDQPVSREEKESISATTPLIKIEGKDERTLRYTPPEIDIFDADRVANRISQLSPSIGTMIFLDEFDVLKRDDQDSDGVLKHLPYLLKASSDTVENRPIHFVIVGLSYSGDNLLRVHKSLARSLVEIRVPRLGEQDVRRFFEMAFKMSGFSASSGVIDYLTQCSAGYPYTMHLLGFSLCEEAESRGTRQISNDAVRAAISSIRNEFSRKARNVKYKSLTPIEIEILVRLSYSWKDGVDVRDIINARKYRIDISDIDGVGRALEALQKKGILVSPDSNKSVFIFADPYARVKVMIDCEAKMISDNRYYPARLQAELPL